MGTKNKNYGNVEEEFVVDLHGNGQSRREEVEDEEELE